jgi:hypothetical protein
MSLGSVEEESTPASPLTVTNTPGTGNHFIILEIFYPKNRQQKWRDWLQKYC